MSDTLSPLEEGRVRIVEVTFEFLAQILTKGIKNFSVDQGLPDDAVILGVYETDTWQSFYIRVASAEYEPVMPGMAILKERVTFTKIY